MKAPTMGMDVYGLNSKAEEGKYFRNNVWYWRPLADLCQSLAPDICAACEHWHTNDGDGLDEPGAMALAKVLERQLADGSIARFVAERDKWLEALPDERCALCDGSGVRCDEIGVSHKMPERVINEAGHPRNGKTGWCNACEGKGNIRPFATHYPCTVENVAEFATFLKLSGGFEIH
jgi:hypothetical protein